MKQSIILLVASLFLFAASIEANLLPIANSTSVCSPKTPCELTWVEDGIQPLLTSLLPTVSVALMTGPNQNQILVKELGTPAPTVGKLVHNISPDLGPPGKFYFYKFTFPTNATNTIWSSRFTIEGIQGEIAGFDPKTVDDKGELVADATSPTQAPNTAVVNAASSKLSTSTAIGLSVVVMAASYLC